MKKAIKLFAILTVSITIYSCTKSTDNSSTSTKPPQPKLQFYGNGVLYNFDAVWDNTSGWTYSPSFQRDSVYVFNQLNVVNVLNGYKYINSNLNNSIWFPLPNLLTSTGSYSAYTNNSGYGSRFEAQLGNSTLDKANSSDTINITTLSNGKASGTFVATIQMTDNSTLQKTTYHITNGTFSNLPIY